MADEVVKVPVPEVTSSAGPAVLEHADQVALKESGEQREQLSKRDQLAHDMREEIKARTTRCMRRIEAILEEEHCVLEARIRLPEVSAGVFGIAAEPGVKAL